MIPKTGSTVYCRNLYLALPATVFRRCFNTSATDSTGLAIAATLGTNSYLSLGAWLARAPTIKRLNGQSLSSGMLLLCSALASTGYGLMSPLATACSVAAAINALNIGR